MKKLFLLSMLAGVVLLAGWRSVASGEGRDAGRLGTEPVVMALEGLLAPVEVVRDSDAIPHVFAENDHDAMFAMGYLHAQDRFFQMDSLRRTFSGTLAELLGAAALPSDVQLRTLGLRRAAELSLPAYSAQMQSIFEAYADGVNAWISDPSHALPPEYGALELTSVEPWTAIDSVVMAKGLAFSLSFDSDDPDFTEALAAFQTAGQGNGFDGTALFFQDLYRSAPFDPTISIPGFAPVAGSASKSPGAVAKTAVKPFPMVRDLLSPETLRLISRVRDRMRNTPYLNRILAMNRGEAGSNWWVVDGAHSETGHPILANDPHLALDAPPVFYEIHLTVSNDPRNGPMNVNGVSFAGAPSIAQGCNDRICWGSTVNPMDVTDFYEEFLAINFSTLLPTDTIFDNQREPLVILQQTYRFNQVGDAQPDNLATADVGPLEGGLTFLVPRRNMGPIIDVDVSNPPNIRGISVQYTGFGATREIEAFYRWTRAGDIDQFREGLQYFDFGSQNWAYADVDGNIAYFTSAELPLREDLQDMGQVDGLPPFMVRDGTHFRRNEWKALQTRQFAQAENHEILPFSEMPQIINPARGYIANANNDPVGTTLDNDVFNTTRPGGGIYYLSPGYSGYRVGRIARLLEAELADGGKLSVEEMMRIQGNNQLIDAEALVPYITQAFANAGRDGAPERLGGLAADARLVEAVQRLSQWDFSTPTGIRAGYDPGDDPANLPEPDAGEIANSVAATIYSAWRGQAIDNVIDNTLERLGVEAYTPPGMIAPAALRNLLDRFDQNQGVGASGVNFFQVDDVGTAADARDYLILQSLAEALDLLAGDSFAAAFNNSTNQDDYRWGYLHRITYDSLLGGPFSVPPAGGFGNLSPNLRGIARSGGFEAVDASSHSARANSVNGFQFGSGPARRFVGNLDPEGIQAYQVIPGGQSGVVGSPFQTNQLGRWLTNQYHPLRLTRAQVMADSAQRTILVPAEHRLYFPAYAATDQVFTGFAVGNLAPSALSLNFTNWGPDGQAAPLPQNPRAVGLDVADQFADLGTDLFSGSPPQDGWVELDATVDGAPPLAGPALASFTQFGTFSLSALDGGVAVTEQAKSLVFTRAYEGAAAFRGRPATTFISLANPNSEAITVELQLREGEMLAAAGVAAPAPITARTVEIPGKGVLAGTLSEIFEDDLQVVGAYVQARVTAGRGAVGTQAIRVDGGATFLGLNASPGSGVSRSFSAQMASTPSVFTNLKLVNVGEAARDVTLTAVSENGSNLAEPVQIRLNPGQDMEADVNALFTFATAQGSGPGFEASVEGSLRIEADGDGIIGDVIFGDPGNLNYAAALPLQTVPFRRAVFSQAAVTNDLFTGLAFFNTGSEEAQVTVQVYQPDGDLAGEATFALAAGARRSDLVEEIVSGLGQQTGGYIVVTSTQPLVGQQLFGTIRLSLLSAVPPTVVQ